MSQGHPQRVIPPNSHGQSCYKIGGVALAAVCPLTVHLRNTPYQCASGSG